MLPVASFASCTLITMTPTISIDHRQNPAVDGRDLAASLRIRTITPAKTIAKESAKYHVNTTALHRSRPWSPPYINPTTANAAQMRPCVIVATISLSLETKATTLHSIGCNTEKALGTSAALRRRVASMRPDVSLSFQAIQSGIHRANRYLAVGAELDLLPHSHPVGAILQPQQRQDNHGLEFATVIAVTHYLYNIEQLFSEVISILTLLLAQVARL
jgi:hypothetical protein